MSDSLPQWSALMSRREILRGTGGVFTAVMASGCSTTISAQDSGLSSYDEAPGWMKLLATSAEGGQDYAPRIEGKIPVGMTGSVYRNGPGLFEVGDSRVGNILDGDGLVQRLSFQDGQVRYRNAFVRTEKYVAEQAGGKRLHSTWSKRRDGGFLNNLGGGDIKSQAGVTIYPIHGKILARDEIGPSYKIDPESLDTLGHVGIGDGLDVDRISFKAHCKFDPLTGEVIYLGTRFGRRMDVHVVVDRPDSATRTQFAFRAPRQVYFHDFALSQNHVVFVMQPCFVNTYYFIAGIKSLIGSMRWKGDESNLIGIVPRAGGEPVYVEAPSCFVWHTLNAHERGKEIVVDFVGYDEPDHFIGDEPLFANMMNGRQGKAEHTGNIRRYRIDTSAKTARVETMDRTSSEFPFLDPRNAMSEQKYGYFANAANNVDGFHNGLLRLDYAKEKTDAFHFTGKEKAIVGEPVFIPKPDGGSDQGWILTQCLDIQSSRAFFALFDAQAIDAGPIAKIWLSHHLPISFHGCWTS